MLPDVLNTEQLRLRLFRLQDVDDVLSYATDPAWARYLPVPQPYTRADAEKFIAGQLLLDESIQIWGLSRLSFTVLDREIGVPTAEYGR